MRWNLFKIGSCAFFVFWMVDCKLKVVFIGWFMLSEKIASRLWLKITVSWRNYASSFSCCFYYPLHITYCPGPGCSNVGYRYSREDWLVFSIHIHWILIYPVGSAIQRLIVIVIACLPTKHVGVHMNSFKRVRAFQIELEVLVFEERRKPEYPEKNLSEQRREPTTNSTHIWRRRI